jgi:hypothetical protein
MLNEKNPTNLNKDEIKENPNQTQLTNKDPIKQRKAEKIKAGLFLTIVTAFGFLSGFGLSFSSTKKRELKELSKEAERSFYYLHESGVELARKALLRATLFSVSGFGIFCFGIWKLSGAQTFDEFRYKIGNILPRISSQRAKVDQISTSRTEFESLTDFIQFIIDEDKKNKELKRARRENANK